MTKTFVRLAVLASFLLAGLPAFAQTPPASPLFETRAVWMATVWGLDWPSAGATPAQQQQRLRDHFQKLKTLGVNTVIFQAVTHGEALYPSERLPWARWLTGTQGQDPGWDPLAFAVEEAHRLGLELHAWYNVSHVGSDTDANRPTTPDHVTLVHPDWIKKAETGLWLNPGLPEVRAWVVENVIEIVEHYDVDAVHFDYMRYPSGGFFDDGNTRQKHPNAGTTIADWRRENVNILARDLYAAVEARKPWVKVGSAPIGAYKNFNGAPPGYWAYDELFQESRRWLEEGVHDYLAPQLYFDIGNAPDPGNSYNSQDFTFWLRDWRASSHNRHIYVGQGTYRESEGAFDRGEIARQIDVSRAEGAQGQVHFRYAFVNASILGGRYQHPALPAPMAWKFNAAAPTTPGDVTIALEAGTSTVTVRWSPSEGAADDPLRRYAVFRHEGAEPDATSADDLVGFFGVQDTSFAETFTTLPEAPVYYRVAAQSHLGFLSEASAAVHTGMTPLAADGPEEPSMLRLTALYPNPATTVAHVTYDVAAPAEVVLTVHDTLGRLVATLTPGTQAPGTYHLTIPTEALGAGVYVVSLQSGAHRDRRCLVLTR